MLNIKFHRKPVYDKKYIKAKVKTFNVVVSTIFWNDEIPKENVHYSYSINKYIFCHKDG